MWQRTKAVLAFIGLMFLASTQASAEQIILVDFNRGILYHWYGDRDQPDQYPVVLPRPDVQETMDLRHPIHGQFTQADYRPTWWPTENMRRDKPTLPRSVPYGHRLHPIGIYRLRIAWQNPNDHSYWQSIRIHGGATIRDLHGLESLGCVRMLDPDIMRMVDNIDRYGGSVRVTFGRL